MTAFFLVVACAHRPPGFAPAEPAAIRYWTAPVPDAFVIDAVGEDALLACRAALAPGSTCQYELVRGVEIVVFRRDALLAVDLTVADVPPTAAWSIWTPDGAPGTLPFTPGR